jgi:thioredoxin 1
MLLLVNELAKKQQKTMTSSRINVPLSNNIYKMGAFTDLINSEQPVLVDFHAEWCGPCKAMSPIIKEVAKAMEGKVKVIKVDIDKNQATAQDLNINAVPTFIIFKKGKVVWRHAGMIDKSGLLKTIENQLS